jgi:DNA repair exonuclease SbcCD ATPase subunit
MPNLREKLRELSKQYDGLHEEYITKKTTRENLMIQKDKKEADIKLYDVESLEQGNVLLQKMSEKQRQDACTKLENLGTHALQYAYSPDREMQIELKEIRKKPNANVYIVNKKTGYREEPVSQNGGGIVDIGGLSLRVIILQSYDPFIDGPIILDEPSKMLSEEYIPQLSEFIRNIAEDFGRQVILITHDKYLAQIADQILSVRLGDDDISIVE